MILAAHRGGTDRFHEQTIDAAEYSLENGADFVELDVRFVRGKIPVICHDPNAKNLFGRDAKINDLTLEQFKSLRFVRSCRDHPHTLEEVFIKKVAPILLHIKEGGERLFQIIDLVRIYEYENHVIYGVQTPGDVKIVKRFGKNYPVLAFMPNLSAASEFAESGADIIRLWEGWVTEETVRLIHKIGKKVWVMAGYREYKTVGCTEPETVRLWKQMGVDGILVNEILKFKDLA